MPRLKFMIVLIIVIASCKQLHSQQVQITKEQLVALTPLWKGERFPDGRPKVPDDILKRMKSVSVEEAWAVMKNAGYGYQVAEDWQVINPDSVLVGRAVTATFMPGRPDVWQAIDSFGKKQGRRSQNVWAVELLVKGDVYVADQFGAHRNGPTIGDNVGNAIYARTGNGIVYDGALRDVEGLKEIGGFTSFYTSYDPSYHNPGVGQSRDLTTMIVGINQPTRIRTVTVMPGDVVGENHYLAYGFRRMLEIGGVDIIMPDLQKCGGLGEGQRIANLANLYYTPFAPHMVASFLGAMASAHVCASVPNFLILEWQSYFHTDPMFKDIIKYDGEWVKDSFITLSEKPGIGVEINEEGMKKYAIPGIPFFE